MTLRSLPWSPALADLRQAQDTITPYVHETPVLSSAAINSIVGCRVSFKSEHLQKAGAFKARGAHNAVFSLPEADAARGVLTHSSGNHGAALALAARTRGIPAHVVMPVNAPDVKKQAVLGYGAEVTECEATLQARESTVADLQVASGATVVHPFDDPAVICGQSTVGLELVEQLADEPPDAVIVPVGGGGLLSGVALAFNKLQPNCEVFGAEPAGADDAKRSFDQRELIPQLAPDTIADGLLTSLGELTFPIILDLVSDILVVDDAQTVEAMSLLFTRAKQVVEPSAAVALAAVLAYRQRFAGGHVAVVLSGGNVDLARLPW